MNYAAQNHIGNDNHSRTAAAAEAASAVRRVRRVDAAAERYSRSAERQTESRSCSNAANGILKCRFLPKLKTAQSVQACQKTERDFYQSLSNLAGHCKVEPMQSKEYGFPYNIVLAKWDIENKLKDIVTDWDSLHLVQNSKKTFLAAMEKYDTGTTLYYISVIPLFKMLKDPKRKKNAQLLLSVFSYLYHIADVPYYRQEESYLYWIYEMHKDWIENDEETDETESYKRELKQAEQIGGIMEQKLYSRINLEVFEQRLSCFKSRDDFDRECYETAYNAFVLYKEYPTASVFRNAPAYGSSPYNDEEYIEIFSMEKYISFVADTTGCLYRQIEESINAEFNEYGIMEQPTIYKPIDNDKISENSFDFETRFFGLIDDLTGLLYEYKKD